MASPIDKTIAPGIYLLENGKYRVKVSVGDRKRGGPPREKTFAAGTATRTMTGWQTDQRAELRRKRLVPATGTLAADIPKYLETLKTKPKRARDRKRELKAWVAQFGDRRRHTLTRDDVRQQVKLWEQAGVAASTIRHRLTALSKLSEELDGEDGNNPVKGVKRPTEPDPVPDSRSPDVIQRVLDALWFRVAMSNRGWKTLARALVLTHTGMRPSQLMRMDPDTDIRPCLEANVPFVLVRVPGKGGKAHSKPLTQNGVAAFRLFLSVGAVGEFSTQSFYKAWMLACDQADVEQFRPYLLRHSYATLLRRGGADIADIQALLGHKSSKTTQRYAMVIPEKLAVATQQMEKMWNQSRGQSAWAGPQVVEKKAASDT